MIRSYNVRYIMVLFAIIYLTPYVLRLYLTKIFHFDFRFSLLFPLIVIILLFKNFNKVNKVYMLIVITIMALSLPTLMLVNTNINRQVTSFVTLFIPLFLVTIGLNENETIIIFKKVIKLINVLAIMNTLYAVIDFVTGGYLQMNLAQILMGSKDGFEFIILRELNSGIYRLFSFIGHPLTNSYFYIIYLCMNLLDKYYVKSNKKIIFIFVNSLIGCLLSNSKLAIILLGIIYLTSSRISRRKLLYFVSILALIAVTTRLPYFQNNVIPRFIEAASSGDITNGRLSAIKAAYYNDVVKPNFFYGNGLGSSEIITNLLGVNNFENPFIMFSYDYGILSTLLIYLVIFINPIPILIKKNQYYPLLLFLIVFVFGNSFNGFSVGTGSFQMFLLFTFLIINLSNIKVDNTFVNIPTKIKY